MEKTEHVIVSLTTWKPRMENIPYVLDTIFNQSLPPDLVVLNLAYDEIVPAHVQNYLDDHNVMIERVPDTKVYKKLIPTLRKYPEDCIISIDDDFLYPKEMIKDFVSLHERYPDFPISGNRFVHKGIPCHCGCASLTKADYFGSYLDSFDGDLFKNCKSDDIAYTFFATKNGHPYIRTVNEYFVNMEPLNQNKSYTDSNDTDIISKSWDYMAYRFGELGRLSGVYSLLIDDDYLAGYFSEIIEYQRDLIEHGNDLFLRTSNSVSYRLGRFITDPVAKLIKMFGRKHLSENS